MRCVVVGVCVLALGSSGDARQTTTPVVHPPAPATNVTVSMAEFLTPGTPPAQAFAQAVDAARQRPGGQGYTLEAGLTPGSTVGTLPLGLTTRFETVAPIGVFFVRVRAIVGGQPGPASNEVRVGVGAAAAPGAPSNLLARLDGSVLRLAWHNTDVGGTRSAVLLEALTPSLAFLGSLRLAASTETLSVPAPPGTFVLRMRAAGPSLSSGASNAVTVTVPGSGVVPDRPQHLTAAANGSAVSIAWDLGVVGSAAPDGWVLEAGDSPSSIPGSLPMSARTFQATAPPGTYYLRVRATSACGTSAATPDVILTVP